MKWFGRSKKKETIGNKAKHPAKLKKDDETISEKTTTKPSIQKIETKNNDSISKKLQLVKEEYNEVVGNIMNAKREQKNMMEKIQKSNNEYDGLKNGIKSLREDLLKVNNELREKNENIDKIMEEYKKHSQVIQEINNSKKEVLELKVEIKKHNDELEVVKTKTSSFPEINKMREEKKKLENELVQKRNEIESSIKELKFIQNEIAGVGKNKESTNVVDAASAVVASIKQKLQNTQKELDLVKKALEQERKK
jgi:chromosome segregation ATPase